MSETYAPLTPRRFKPYFAYRPSGVEWLGDVPAHWAVRRIKTIFREVDERTGDVPGELLSLTRAHGLIPQVEATNRIASVEDLSSYKICRPGFMVMNRMQAWSGMFAVSTREGLISPDYCIFGLADSFEVTYFEYLFKTSLMVGQFAQKSKGIGSGFNRLYTDDFGSIPSFVPPPSEQAGIARYLDQVDRRIRRYIEAKEKLIGLLEEEKQAVVNQAVTRGLDPNVPLKPSGVEWLGDVPAHWEVRTLGQIADSFRTGPFGSLLHQSDYVEGGIPVINPVHMRDGGIIEDPSCTVSGAVADKLSDYRLGLHDLVFSRRGELGRCALVRGRETSWLCGTGSIRVRIVYGDMDPEFLLQALQVRWVGEYLSLVSVGATMANLNTGILKGVPILVPPSPEQRDLLEYIGRRSRTIDDAVARARRQIELLQEYRTRLVADVVTGKLDVREAAAQLPEGAGASTRAV